MNSLTYLRLWDLWQVTMQLTFLNQCLEGYSCNASACLIQVRIASAWHASLTKTEEYYFGLSQTKTLWKWKDFFLLTSYSWAPVLRCLFISSFTAFFRSIGCPSASQDSRSYTGILLHLHCASLTIIFCGIKQNTALNMTHLSWQTA